MTIFSVSQGLVNLQFRYSDDEIREKLNYDENTSIEHLTFNNQPIRALFRVSSKSNPWVVFIHGAPGSCSDYIGFFKDSLIQEKFNLVSIDRPGYGFSGFGNSVTSISNQAALMHRVIQDKSISGATLVGHSFGGPVVAKMAMDYPSEYRRLIMLAPAIDPEFEKMFGVAKLACWKLTRWMVPKVWRVAADEKFSHAAELDKMLTDWQKLDMKVIHVHGDKDVLVPYENLAFSRKVMGEKTNFESISLTDANHFLPWSHFSEVKDIIVNNW